VASKYLAILFDIDGTLIITCGAGAASWRMAFDELCGIPADIGQLTDTGMTDPDVGCQTFVAVTANRVAPSSPICWSDDCTTSTRRRRTQRATGSSTVSRNCCLASSTTGTCSGS
jgi:hypothetical protein